MTTLAQLLQRFKIGTIYHEDTKKTRLMNKKYREEDSVLVKESFFE